jgi:AcrR family transcriptional regulator
MNMAAATSGRPLRADARRNRDRLLEVANAAFAEHGLDIGVAEIARRAGVGSATLFRHFATKEDLISALLEQRLDEMDAVVAAASELQDPGEAFRSMMVEVVRLQVRDRALVQCMVGVEERTAQPQINAHVERFVSGVQSLLSRAQAARVIRDDVVAEDLLAILSGIAGTPMPRLGRPELAERYLAIVLDGLRPNAPTPLHIEPAVMADLTAARLRAR